MAFNPGFGKRISMKESLDMRGLLRLNSISKEVFKIELKARKSFQVDSIFGANIVIFEP